MSIDPVTAILNVGNSIIERLWPDPSMQAAEKLKLATLAQNGDLAQLDAQVKLLVGQMEINKIEASSSNWFVAGWRPFVGWVCGFALAYAAILEPIMRFTAKMLEYAGEFPTIDTDITMQVLLGMLGLGVMRTSEKVKGVAKK